MKRKISLYMMGAMLFMMGAMLFTSLILATMTMAVPFEKAQFNPFGTYWHIQQANILNESMVDVGFFNPQTGLGDATGFLNAEFNDKQLNSGIIANGRITIQLNNIYSISRYSESIWWQTNIKRPSLKFYDSGLKNLTNNDSETTFDIMGFESNNFMPTQKVNIHFNYNKITGVVNIQTPYSNLVNIQTR